LSVGISYGEDILVFMGIFKAFLDKNYLVDVIFFTFLALNNSIIYSPILVFPHNLQPALRDI
jgi:hypothetical protein